MSEQRFDELTKSLAAKASSRRTFLSGLAGAAAAVLVRPTLGSSSPGGSTCANQGQSCTAQQCCQGLNCLADGTNSTEKFCCSPDTTLVCGRNCCPTGALGSCAGGNCVCPVGEVVCPDANNPLAGKCVNLVEDPDNCGQCGVVCGGPTGADAPCRVRACVNGTCTTVPNPAAQGTPCNDDNDLCTLETCQNGNCTSTGQNVSCPPSTNPCKVNVCAPATGMCVEQNVTDGIPCNTDNDLCRLETCQNGTCTPTGQNMSCPACQVCNPATGTCTPIPGCQTCSNASTCPKPSDQCQQATCIGGVCGVAPRTGSSCNDNNPCTRSDTCQSNGLCSGTPVVCAPGTVCCMGAGVPTSNAGKCLRPTGATCAAKADCCSNNCTAGRCV